MQINKFLRSFWTLSSTPNSITLPILGRWSLKSENHIRNRTIDLNNYDHCGCCEYKFEHSANHEEELLPYFLD